MTINSDKKSINKKRIQDFKPFDFPGPDPGSNSIHITRPFLLQKDESIVVRGLGENECIYILDGEIVISCDNSPDTVIKSEGEMVRPYYMPRGGASIGVKASQDSIFYHVDPDSLAHLLFLSELKHILDNKHQNLSCRADELASALAFQNLPHEYICEAINRMQIMEVKNGQEIITQGDEGLNYYIFDSGRAEVLKEEFPGDGFKKINELGPGDGFGEYSLVSNRPRSASVRMITNGRLLTLDRESFIELVSNPVLEEIDPESAYEAGKQGAIFLDIRYEEENEEAYIPGSICNPLDNLIKLWPSLDRERQYIIYCRSGKRSRTAALLLKQHNFNAISLKGGVKGWPYELEGFGAANFR